MQEALIEKLRKLIEHEKSARDIGSLAEAEAFAAKIQKLMFDAKLEMTDIEYAEQEANEPVASEYLTDEEVTGVHRESRKSQGWISILTEAVSKANFCKAVGASRRGNSFTLIGRESDRLAAKATLRYLYEACREVLERQSAEYVSSGKLSEEHDELCGYYTPTVLKRRFTQAFKVGFACGIADRLDVQKVELLAGANETGLIRIDQLEKAVQEKLDDEFPSTRSGGKITTKGRAGFEAGKAYGSSIGINSIKRLTA